MSEMSHFKGSSARPRQNKKANIGRGVFRFSSFFIGLKSVRPFRFAMCGDFLSFTGFVYGKERPTEAILGFKGGKGMPGDFHYGINRLACVCRCARSQVENGHGLGGGDSRVPQGSTL